jgi:hypothetical protein
LTASHADSDRRAGILARGTAGIKGRKKEEESERVGINSGTGSDRRRFDASAPWPGAAAAEQSPKALTVVFIAYRFRTGSGVFYFPPNPGIL